MVRVLRRKLNGSVLSSGTIRMEILSDLLFGIKQLYKSQKSSSWSKKSREESNTKSKKNQALSQSYKLFNSMTVLHNVEDSFDVIIRIIFDLDPAALPLSSNANSNLRAECGSEFVLKFVNERRDFLRRCLFLHC